MDAFHLGHRVLVRRGQTEIKGAPETFDAVGYLHLLRRIRTETGTVYAPEFDRDIEDSLAHVVEIGPEVGLVVTEGNYLLLDTPPWADVRGLLDEAWFVHLDDAERQRRMLARHRRHGHDQTDAEARTFGNDERNARLVNAAPNHPDLWIEQQPGRPIRVPACRPPRPTSKPARPRRPAERRARADRRRAPPRGARPAYAVAPGLLAVRVQRPR